MPGRWYLIVLRAAAPPTPRAYRSSLRAAGITASICCFVFTSDRVFLGFGIRIEPSGSDSDEPTFDAFEATPHLFAEDKTIFSQPPGNTSQSFSASVLKPVVVTAWAATMGLGQVRAVSSITATQKRQAAKDRLTSGVAMPIGIFPCLSVCCRHLGSAEGSAIQARVLGYSLAGPRATPFVGSCSCIGDHSKSRTGRDAVVILSS
jgi:hypothetical protein